MERDGFRHRGFPRLVVQCCNGIQVSSKNKDTSIWNVVPNSELFPFFCFMQAYILPTTDHFSGPGRALDRMCVCVCPDNKFEQNDL